MAEVIALAGWPAEILAFAYAKYSRSNLPIKQSILAISNDKASGFLETYYFQYGHASIADNAHIPIAFEGISELAAYQLEDEQLIDCQEQSTRYQNFAKKDSYFVPPSVRNTPFYNGYMQIGDYNLKQYKRFFTLCFNWLKDKNPKPNGMSDSAYERNLQARAFDVARYWLFNGILTSVGQITSARTLEGQVSRLMSSEYEELRELGEKIKQACKDKPFCPEGQDQPPVAPTLVKYAAPNQYTIALRKRMRTVAKDILGNTPILNQRYVKLAPEMYLEDEIIATLLYEVSQHSYLDILSVLQKMPKQEKEEIIKRSLADRGNHDPVPKAFAAGYQIQYDIVMDRGGERDLHRHRNCIQIHQPLTTLHGWDTPALIEEMGLADDFNRGMAQVGWWVEKLRKDIGNNADYLIPFAYRSGTLYKMHLAQAIYMTELRSGVKGHFSYREVACQMHDQLVAAEPWLAGHIRVTPFEQQDILKR